VTKISWLILFKEIIIIIIIIICLYSPIRALASPLGFANNNPFTGLDC
jgi:hypothetical protein